jgi:hypothetical protein
VDLRVSSSSSTAEKKFYDKVSDMFATSIDATSIDYDTRTDSAREFFATVQNKFHFAITGHTAAEIVAGRVDSSKPQHGVG